MSRPSTILATRTYYPPPLTEVTSGTEPVAVYVVGSSSCDGPMLLQLQGDYGAFAGATILTDGPTGATFTSIQKSHLLSDLTSGDTAISVVGVLPAGVLFINQTATNDVPLYWLDRWNGSMAWSLSSNVVSKLIIEGGWVIAVNQSGQHLFVNPLTGTESHGPGGAAGNILMGTATRGAQVSIEAVDQTKNLVLLSEGDGEYQELAYSAVCG